jgi:hypothetical protein
MAGPPAGRLLGSRPKQPEPTWPCAPRPAAASLLLPAVSAAPPRRAAAARAGAAPCRSQRRAATGRQHRARSARATRPVLAPYVRTPRLHCRHRFPCVEICAARTAASAKRRLIPPPCHVHGPAPRPPARPPACLAYQAGMYSFVWTTAVGLCRLCFVLRPTVTNSPGLARLPSNPFTVSPPSSPNPTTPPHPATHPAPAVARPAHAPRRRAPAGPPAHRGLALGRRCVARNGTPRAAPPLG